MITSVVRAKNICFQVDQEAIRAVVELFERHEIRFQIHVTTIDGHAPELNSSNFLIGQRASIGR